MKPALLLASLVVAALTIIPALFDGQRRFRWGEDSEVAELTKRLDQFPTELGEWKTSADVPVAQSAVDLLRPIKAINRIYVNSPRQLSAHVFVLLGPTGPTAAHTPEICFNARDYRLTDKPKMTRVDGDSGNDSECMSSKFQSRNAAGSFLNSWHAWTTDGTWEVPENPRFYFANNRYLFKVQVAISYDGSEEEENQAVMDQFIADIEQSLRNTVF